MRGGGVVSAHYLTNLGGDFGFLLDDEELG